MIVSFKKLLKIVQKEKDKGKKIIFTNGCFDIIHKGHIYLLKEAKKHGDFLIVALNSDASVKKIKGKNRPILHQEQRAFIIDNIKGVDAVVLFDEKTPEKLIKRIKPDVLVKGGDYEKEKVVGYKTLLSYGGKVVLVPYLKKISTTKIITKIKNG